MHLESRLRQTANVNLHQVAKSFLYLSFTFHYNYKEISGFTPALSLKGLVHDNAHAHRLSLQNKFVGSTLNSKSPLPVQSLKILRFIPTSVALAGLVILR